MKTILTVIVTLCVSTYLQAQTIEKFSIDSGGASSTSIDGTIEILYTIGEVMVQERSAGNIQVSEGFINPTQLSITVNATVFLQGPIDDPTTPGLMNDDLREDDLIPNTSPYNDGLLTTAAVLNVTGTDAIVDWVWVELRDATDRTIALEGRSALLQRDGNIVGVDGVSAVSFNATADNYYVLISHRNHLSILSATPVAIDGATFVDLSSDPLDVFGNTNAVAAMGGGIYALYGGDFNEDGQILNTDIAGVLPLSGTSGYSNSDSNMDGQTLNTDIQLIIQPNSGRGIQY